jgi:hypothetical protein
MTKSDSDRTRDKEARKRARGLREIRVWVPDRDKYGPEPEKTVRTVAADECAKIEGDEK